MLLAFSKSNDSPFFVKIAIFSHEKSVFCLPTKGAFFNEIRPCGRVKSTFGGRNRCAVKSRFAGDGRISFHPRTKSEDFTNVADVDFTASDVNDFTVEHAFSICYTAFEVSMMVKGKLSALSMDFAVSTLILCGSIKGHYSLVNQLNVPQPVSAPISGKQITRTANRISLRNFKLR